MVLFCSKNYARGRFQKSAEKPNKLRLTMLRPKGNIFPFGRLVPFVRNEVGCSFSFSFAAMHQLFSRKRGWHCSFHYEIAIPPFGDSPCLGWYWKTRCRDTWSGQRRSFIYTDLAFYPGLVSYLKIGPQKWQQAC